MNRTSYVHRQGARPEQQDESADEQRSPFAGVAGRFAQWITGMDRLPADESASAEPEPEPGPESRSTTEPLWELTAGAVGLAEPVAPAGTASPARPVAPARTTAPARSAVPAGQAASAEAHEASEAGGAGGAGRFPVAPLGYNRAAVDEYLADLERELTEMDGELAELRSKGESLPSVTEELERIGEQTASILVVAHDKANETTRRAQEEADRCIADAAANAVALTEGAKRRLQELDAETDAVWRERERLLEDVRAVSSALAALADQASERFPAADPPPSAAGEASSATAPRRAPAAFVPEETMAFTPAEEAEARGEAHRHDAGAGAFGEPGDTASWLAGFEPPEPDPPHA